MLAFAGIKGYSHRSAKDRRGSVKSTAKHIMDSITQEFKNEKVGSARKKRLDPKIDYGEELRTQILKSKLFLAGRTDPLEEVPNLQMSRIMEKKEGDTARTTTRVMTRSLAGINEGSRVSSKASRATSRKST